MAYTLEKRGGVSIIIKDIKDRRYFTTEEGKPLTWTRAGGREIAAHVGRIKVYRRAHPAKLWKVERALVGLQSYRNAIAEQAGHSGLVTPIDMAKVEESMLEFVEYIE